MQTEQDIIAAGNYSLGLERIYKSFAAYTSMFGTRWQSTYDYARLRTSGCARHSDYPNRCLPTSVVLTFPDGSAYTYTSKTAYDFNYTVRSSSKMGVMTYTPDSGYMVRTTSAIYYYSAAGIIQSISTADGSGSTLQFSYPSASSSLPTKITNAAGKSINFAYNCDKYVSSVTDSAGNVWTYQYTNVNLLTTVTSPGPSPDVKTYFYE